MSSRKKSSNKAEWDSKNSGRFPQLPSIRYVICHTSQQRIANFVLDEARRSRLLIDHLETSLKHVGKYAVKTSTGRRLPLSEARRALRLAGRCRDTARQHIDLLIEAGEMTCVGDDSVRLRVFRGSVDGGSVRPLPSDALYWAERRLAKRARRRATDAAAKKSVRPCPPKKGDRIVIGRPKTSIIPEACADVRSPVKTQDTVPAPLAPAYPGRVRPQTPEPQPSAEAAVEAMPRGLGICGRLRVPDPIPEAELEALERELVGEIPAVDEAPPAPEHVLTGTALDAALAAMVARCAAADDVAPAPAEAPSAPPEAPDAPSAPAAAQGPVRVPDVVRLAEEHGIHTLNVVAVVRTGAPYSLVRQAFSITAESLGRPLRRHGPVRDPPAFLLGTLRRLLLGRCEV